VAHRDGVAVALVLVALAELRSASSDQRQGGGGGCSRRAPCKEKGGAGRKFWAGGDWCLLMVWGGGSRGRGCMGAAPRDGAWGRGPGTVPDGGVKRFKPFPNSNGSKMFKFF
jgi:hypothetical protein